ncbi:MAG: hypothetical protein R3F43_13320 [bacterium]
MSRSTTTFDAELVDLTKQVVGPRNGEYLVKVSRDGMAAAAPYRVSATVTRGRHVPRGLAGAGRSQQRRGSGDPARLRPDRSVRRLDLRERGGRLVQHHGAGRRGPHDLHRVPEQRRRPPLPRLPGRSVRSEDMFSGFRRSADPVGNAQCINVRGGAQDQEVLFRVFANLVRPDGDNRVDYSVRVVPTDLSGLAPGNPAAQYHDHQGECLTLGGGDLGTCPFEDPFADGCWPFAILP